MLLYIPAFTSSSVIWSPAALPSHYLIISRTVYIKNHRHSILYILVVLVILLAIYTHTNASTPLFLLE
jgi:hypothetical protein